MKKIFFTISLFAFVYANGQDNSSTDKVYKSQLKFSLGHFFDNTLFFNYEKQLENNNSFLIGAGPVYSRNSNMTKSGFLSEIQYKLYITSKDGENSRSRIYVAPYLSYKYLEKNTESNNPNYVYPTYYFHSFCPGIIAGFNIVTYKRLVFDIFVGGGMKRTFDGDFIGKIDYDNANIFEPGYNGVIPRFGFEMGITL